MSDEKGYARLTLPTELPPNLKDAIDAHIAQAVKEKWKHEAQHGEGLMYELCWIEEPNRFLACDRQLNHLGMHTWEFANRIGELEVELLARPCDAES